MIDERFWYAVAIAVAANLIGLVCLIVVLRS